MFPKRTKYYFIKWYILRTLIIILSLLDISGKAKLEANTTNYIICWHYYWLTEVLWVFLTSTICFNILTVPILCISYLKRDTWYVTCECALGTIIIHEFMTQISSWRTKELRYFRLRHTGCWIKQWISAILWPKYWIAHSTVCCFNFTVGFYENNAVFCINCYLNSFSLNYSCYWTWMKTENLWLVTFYVYSCHVNLLV